MTSRIHHLNCGTMRPPAARVPRFMPPELVAHCLLVEQDSGLTLVDTGFGADDVHERARRLGRPFVLMVGPTLDPAETALTQLRLLGYDPRDVRDIVLTHLDLDHAGGLADFPEARVHVHSAELDAALHPSLAERQRYLAAQWAHGPEWVEHAPGGDDWHGFESVRAIGDDVVLVPLHGHTRGHSGVAVRRPDGGWLLHAGDAYFHTGDLTQPRSCPPGLRVFQRMMCVDNEARRANLARLQELHASARDVTVFSAHDASELQRLRAAYA